MAGDARALHIVAQNGVDAFDLFQITVNGQRVIAPLDAVADVAAQGRDVIVTDTDHEITVAFVAVVCCCKIEGYVRGCSAAAYDIADLGFVFRRSEPPEPSGNFVKALVDGGVHIF